MAITSLSTKGQIVIPKAIRDSLKLKSGAKLVINVEGDRIIIQPIKENLADRLYGKYRGVDLLGDLRQEHQQELGRDAKRGR